MTFPWLTVLGALPLVGGLVVALLPGRGSLHKTVSLAVSLVVLALTVVLALQFNPTGGMQFVEEAEWISAFGAHYALGLNGIGLLMILLTAILTPVVILASWNDAEGGRWGARSFFSWMLILEGLSIGVFAATDVFLFYVLFEATLVPIYFLIGGFGGARRSYAASKVLIYSLFGGLLMLASVIGLYAVSSVTPTGPTYLLSDLSHLSMDPTTER